MRKSAQSSTNSRSHKDSYLLVMPHRLYRLILLACLVVVLNPAGAGVLDRLDLLGSGARAPIREFLPPDQAFKLGHDQESSQLLLNFEIAPDYYLYRDRMKVESLTPGLEVGDLELPTSESKDDPEFGRVEIYRGNATVRVPIALPAGTAASAPTVRVTYQGCAEDGICYPPTKKEITLSARSAGSAASAAPMNASPAQADSAIADRLAADLGRKSLPQVVLWFLIAGLALALTPCVFPMIPILSGIIVGQRQPITAWRGFGLALIYVLAMATTYALVGLVAGLFGRNLQAVFQHPAVLVGFSLMFVALACSMFGFYHLQVPALIQTRIETTSRRQPGGSLLGVATMGVLSAIIVGPCVAPPLAAALLYLSHQGSPLIGGAALFALGLGMGAPLLILGASAGRVLPRAGAWMETVKHAFGVVFLGLAIWFLERLIPPSATLALWATLLIGAAIYLGALEPLREAASGWQRFWKGIGLVMLCYGVVLIVGAGAGADDPLRPLAPLAGRDAHHAAPMAEFMSIKGTAELDLAIAAARVQGKPVLVDFYADWCIECKRLERNTFADLTVRRLLSGFVLLRADLTASDAADTALLKRYELHGPPAVLFFNDAGVELRRHRLIGYLGPEAFGEVLALAYGS